MADMPDDEQPETFIQKAVKIGLITIPLMMYVSWAHRKFVPCPPVKCLQARPSLLKKTAAKGKRKNKKGKCQDSRPANQEHKRKRYENSCQESRSAKQEHKRGICQESWSADQNYHDQLSWFEETNEKDMELTKDKYTDYLERSTKECCESVNKNVEGYRNSKTDTEQPLDAHQHTSKTNTRCCQQMREEKTEADTCSPSNTQSEIISPEAFDKLFEQHFQQCVDDFKQHKIQLEKELEHLKEDCETKQRNKKQDEANKKGNYLECLADLNLDKDFDCDPNFHSKDSNAPYVVKDYKCKPARGTVTKEGKSGQDETITNGYLKCLTDLNMDKHFEEKQETQSYYVEKIVNNESCPTSKENGNCTNAQKKKDECKTDTYQKIEELCKDGTVCGEYTPKDLVEDNKIHRKAQPNDYGCDPRFNTKDTDKYGTIKGQPCAYRSVKEDNTDDDALKDFWHTCGPPKGLRTGCQADGCNPHDKPK